MILDLSDGDHLVITNLADSDQVEVELTRKEGTKLLYLNAGQQAAYTVECHKEQQQ